MSYHLNAQGQFQSDQYPDMRPDDIVLSFRDPAAMEALHAFADLSDDDDLAVAIVKRLDARSSPKCAVNSLSAQKNLF